MMSANLFALLAFAAVIAIGSGLIWWQGRHAQRPAARIRMRLEEARRANGPVHHDALEHLERARLLAQRQRRRARLGPVVGGWLTRLNTLGGRGAWIRLLLAAALGALVASGIVLYFDWHDLIELKVMIGLPLLFAFWSFAGIVRSFRKRFLAQLPEALDMVRRASRAGVPPIQALRNVGNDIPAPLGPEFRTIGDSLFLGDDIDEVLDEASERIRIPEFSFFAVFLKTQRATGGPLSETLENLSEILRERTTLDLKARALTSEGRSTAVVMAALPFAIFILLFLVNREYVMVLLVTDAGQRLLIICAVMIAIGMAIIKRLSRLED